MERIREGSTKRMTDKIFSPMELDAIGEVMNISLGSSATAVSNLLDHRVEITTPTVSVFNGIEFKPQKTVSGKRHVFNCTLEDRDGRIWAGSCSGAMIRDIGSKTFRPIGPSWKGRNDEGVLCIIEHKGSILMGTSDGVKVFDRRTGCETATKIFDQFKNKVIYSIACDENGILWLNTSSGIGYVDSNYGNVYTFGNADGLYNEGNECRKFTSADGIIYFGQVTAVNTIDRIQMAPLRDRLHHLVEKRFRGELSKCEGCKLCK